MTTACPRCKSDLTLSDDLAEKRVQCPACHHGFSAPPLPATPLPIPLQEPELPSTRKPPKPKRRVLMIGSISFNFALLAVVVVSCINQLGGLCLALVLILYVLVEIRERL